MKFVRMRSKTQSIVLFFLHFDPVIDEILSKHVSLEQEFVIAFEGFECSEQRIGHSRHLGNFFGRKFVKVLVERVTRIDAILDRKSVV